MHELPLLENKRSSFTPQHDNANKHISKHVSRPQSVRNIFSRGSEEIDPKEDVAQPNDEFVSNQSNQSEAKCCLVM